MSNEINKILDVPVKSLRALNDSLNYIRRAKLWLQVLVAMVLGIGVGILLSPDLGFVSASTGNAIGEWISLPGKLFLALIQMIVVPLILASIIQGICSAVDIEQLKSTGIGVAIFFLTTTILAVVIGISVGTIVKPGSYIKADQFVISESINPLANNDKTQDQINISELPSKFTNLLPKNPMGSIVKGEMLQIVVFAIIIGIGLLLLRRESARPLLDLFSSTQEVSMAIVGLAMSFAPLAVFGMLAQSMIQTGPQVLLGLGVYTITVIGAMAILYAVYILIAFFLGQKSPWEFIKAAREPTLIGFSTNSSAATMPVTVKNAEEGLHIRPSLSQFIIPLGATINMGGTACYQGLTTIFMAQLYGLDLPISALTALTVTAVGASIGTPAVPGVGIVVLSGVLSSAGVPLSGVSIIIGVDRILERFRTSLNVTGDLAACTVMERFSPKLKEEEQQSS